MKEEATENCYLLFGLILYFQGRLVEASKNLKGFLLWNVSSQIMMVVVNV